MREQWVPALQNLSELHIQFTRGLFSKICLATQCDHRRGPQFSTAKIWAARCGPSEPSGVRQRQRQKVRGVQACYCAIDFLDSAKVHCT